MKKFLDWEGISFLWKKITEEFPDSKTLINIINAIDETKADKDEIPSTLPANGGNADSLGGIAASSYLQKTEAPGYNDILTTQVATDTYQPKGNYATAAQGQKADSALQEITTTANGGLKVTNKNQIDIDTNIVFVFNCGSSTELVD